MAYQYHVAYAEGRFKHHIRSIRKSESQWFQFTHYEIDAKGNVTFFFKSSQNTLSFQAAGGWCPDFFAKFDDLYYAFREIKYQTLADQEAEFRAAGLTDEQLKLVL